MNSSGMKRGLAVSAVAAMALTGVSITAPAFADSVQDQTAANTVKLVSPSGGIATVSTANDGVDSTVHLTARAGAGTTQIQFVYNDGTDHNIGAPVTASADGFYEFDWTPPPTLNNTSVDVRADGLDALGNPTATSAAQTVTIDPGANAVNLSSTPDTIGVYNPAGTSDWFGAVSGTTNDLAADPNIHLKALGGGPNSTEDNSSDVNTGDTSRTFSGVVNFQGYSWSSGSNAVNDGVVRATDDSDDATLVHLYKQDLSTATVTATAANPSIPAGGSTSATVKVIDAQGNPIVGVSVKEVGGAAQPTNSLGEATFSGLSGSAAGTDYSFFVDGNGNGSWDQGSEFKRSVTVTEYAVEPGTLTASGADDAYDFDELAGGEFTATLKDTQGNPMQVSGTDRLTYQWSVAPFDPNATVPVQPRVLVPTDAQGKAVIGAPNGTVPGTYTLQVWKEADGTPGATSGDLLADPVTVVLGEAQVVWDAGSRVSAQAGDPDASFTGSLKILDNNGDTAATLDGRDVNITLTRATNGADPDGDAVIAPQADQGANVTRLGDTHATVKTDADGNFAIKVKDQTVRDESVSPATGAADFGDTLAAQGATSQIGANTPVNLVVDFMNNAVKSIDVANNTVIAQGTHGTAIPGVPDKIGTITVNNTDGDPLVGQDVTITVDHGYLTKLDAAGNPVPASAPTEGGLVGKWQDDGQSVTVKTDDNGQVKNALAAVIGHDDGFATDDEVEATVTVTAGGVDSANDGDAATHPADPIEWRSDDALNPTDLTLELSVADDQDPSLTALPDAALRVDGNNRYVYLLATATDQFGNRVALDSDTTETGAGWLGTGPSTTAEAGWPASVEVQNDDVAGTQTVTTTVDGTGAATVWHDTNTTAGNPPAWSSVAADQADLSASQAINWYAVDFDSSTFALSHDTADTVKPGTTVIETYTAKDQHGAPIDGADVTFLRTGPDELQDGDGNTFPDTDDSGVARYIFQGTKAGDAIITAVMEDGDGNPVAASQVNDKVTFAAAAPTRKKIRVSLTAKNVKKGNDRLTVFTQRIAKGAKVRLFRVTKHGVLKRVGGKRIAGKNIKTIGAHGFAHFTVKEPKKGQKRHKTTYVVKVSHTDLTKAAHSNYKKIR